MIDRCCDEQCCLCTLSSVVSQANIYALYSCLTVLLLSSLMAKELIRAGMGLANSAACSVPVPDMQVMHIPDRIWEIVNP